MSAPRPPQSSPQPDKHISTGRAITFNTLCSRVYTQCVSEIPGLVFAQTMSTVRGQW